jgi:hypothetical protein
MTPNNLLPPVPHNSLLRAIRGPLLLISLGVLVWIDFIGKVRFTRTWPVLMIVYGVLKLAEMAGSANRGN